MSNRAPALAASIVLAACGGGAPTPDTTPAPASTATAAAPATPDPGDPLVLDFGEEPRRELRYRVPAGTIRDVEFRYDLAIEMFGTRTVSPTMVMAGTYDVLGVEEDGVHRAAFTIDDTDLLTQPGGDPSVADAMRANLEQLEHARYVTEMTPRGRVLSTKLDPTSASPGAAELFEQTRDLANQTTPILPVAAVGRGARWRSINTIEHSGIRMELTADVELLDVTGDTIRMRTDMTLRAPPQELVLDTGTSQVEATGTGTADSTLDLATFRSTATMSMDMTMHVSTGGQTATMRMTQAIGMVFR